MVTGVTKRLLNNMVRCFLHQNFKAWRADLVTILSHISLRHCIE